MLFASRKKNQPIFNKCLTHNNIKIMKYFFLFFLMAITITCCRKPRYQAEIGIFNLSSGPIKIYFKDPSTGQHMMKELGSNVSKVFVKNIISGEVGDAPYLFFVPDSIINVAGQRFDTSYYSKRNNWQENNRIDPANSGTVTYLFKVNNNQFQ